MEEYDLYNNTIAPNSVSVKHVFPFRPQRLAPSADRRCTTLRHSSGVPALAKAADRGWLDNDAAREWLFKFAGEKMA
jgi:hypothetical protein